jgi:hypothetical protein
MSKKLSIPDLTKIVTDLLESDIVDDRDDYRRIVSSISNVIIDYCGGSLKKITEDKCEEWYVEIDINHDVPDDGGVYKDYDNSKKWEKGHEINISTEVVHPLKSGYSVAADRRDNPSYIRILNKKKEEITYIDKNNLSKSTKPLLTILNLIDPIE